MYEFIVQGRTLKKKADEDKGKKKKITKSVASSLSPASVSSLSSTADKF